MSSASPSSHAAAGYAARSAARRAAPSMRSLSAGAAAASTSASSSSAAAAAAARRQSTSSVGSAGAAVSAAAAAAIATRARVSRSPALDERTGDILPPPGDQLRLSDVLRHYPSCYDAAAARLSVVEKYVVHVDAVPERMLGVTHVYLSNNSISSLAGMRQFYNLRAVSLSNNCIDDLNEVAHLAACEHLQILSLEYNPVTQMPHYRAHIIRFLPQVKLLDNKEITPVERQQAEITVKREEKVMDLMFSNEMLIEKLHKALLKMRVHAELRSVVFGRISIFNRSPPPPPIDVDTRRLLQIWGFDEPTEGDRRRVSTRLRNDVRKAYTRHNSENAVSTQAKKGKSTELWDQAFSVVMTQQQTRIAELLSAVDTERQRALESAQRARAHDPHNTASLLREQENEIQDRRTRERDALINDLRSTIRRLDEEYRLSGVNPAQSSDYQRKMRRLQTQLERVTAGDTDFAGNASTFLQPVPPPRAGSFVAPSPVNTPARSRSAGHQRPGPLPSASQQIYQQQQQQQRARSQSPAAHAHQQQQQQQQHAGGLGAPMHPSELAASSASTVSASSRAAAIQRPAYGQVPHYMSQERPHGADVQQPLPQSAARAQQQQQQQQPGAGAAAGVRPSRIPRPGAANADAVVVNAASVAAGAATAAQRSKSMPPNRQRAVGAGAVAGTSAASRAVAAASADALQRLDDAMGDEYSGSDDAAERGVGSHRRAGVRSESPPRHHGAQARASGGAPMPAPPAPALQAPSLGAARAGFAGGAARAPSDVDGGAASPPPMPRAAAPLPSMLSRASTSSLRAASPPAMAAGGGGAASPAGSRARLSAGSPADLQSVAGLQRQVELLQRDIEQHVATETMFQNVNIQLRERLELFQRQNQENVDRAEEEISRLHNELAQMAAERARMAGELESLRPLVGQLAQSRENERAVQQQRERVQSELDDTVAALGTARDEVARLTNEHQYVSNMASQYLGELRKMVSQQESREVRLDRMLELRRQHASRMAFAMMRRFVRVAALERKVAARRNAQLLRESHARWAARMALEQRVQALQARANRERLVLAFARVRLLRTLGIAERRQWAGAVAHHRVQLQRRFVRHWRVYHHQYDLPAATETALMTKAAKFHADYALSSHFAAWHWHVRVVVRQHKRTKAVGIEHARRLALRQRVRQWLGTLQLRRVYKTKLQLAVKFDGGLLCHTMLSRWMTFVAQRRAQHAREAALRRMQLRALWARWVDTAERKRGHALRVVRAQQSGWLAYGMHWMRKWRAYAARRARVERLQRRADVYRRSALGSRTLSLWRVTAVRVADLRRQMLERQAAVTRRVWGAWRTFVSERFELQRADLRAVRHFQQQLVRRKRGCLAEWQRFVRRRRAARQGQQRLAERVERARLSVPFAAWKQALLERVCRALRDERQHVNDMNIDNLNLTERLQQFQRQVSDLDTRLSAMSLKLQDAQSQARDSVTREQALQAQIDSLRHEAAAVYEQHALLRSKIGDTSDEAMSLRTQHALELSSQQQQIRSLNNQLDESNRLVATLQEAIERLNAELAAKDRAAEAKLAQVFDVASSLRQMLEEKEHTIVTLAGEREQQDAALADLQRRWVSDSAALAQTIETRDDQLQRLRLALHNAPVPPSSATLADASGGDAQASGDGGLLGARRTTMSASDVPVGLADPSTNAGDAAGGAAPVPVAAAAGAGAGAGVGVGVGLRAQSWRQQPLVPGQMFGSSGAGDALGAAYGAAYAQRPLSLPDDGLLGDGLGAAGGAFTPGGASADEWTTAQRVLGASSSSSLSEEIEQQRRAAALTRAALDLKRSELGQRADDFHARLANVDDIFATPASAAPVSAPLGSAFQAFAFTGGSSRTLSPPPAARVDASMASLPRTTSHASAPPAPLGSAQRIDSLQSEIDVLRQQIMSRLTSPRQSGASLAAAPDTAASQRVGVGRTRTQASYTPASRAGGAFESPALSSSHAASRASTASSFVVRDRTSVYDTTSAAVRSEVHARVRETHAD